MVFKWNLKSRFIKKIKITQIYMYTILIVKDIVAGNCEKRKGLKCLQLQLQMACICVNLVAHHFKAWNSTHFKISSLTSDIFVGKGTPTGPQGR